jgi:four helix bundle protein
MQSSPKPRLKSFRDLIAWQRAIELVSLTYRATESFPRREIYGLVSQMRRAAISIPANISEGYGRGTTKDYLRFLGIAAGSLRELETYCEVSKRLGYATEIHLGPITRLTSETGAILNGLSSKLRATVCS